MNIELIADKSINIFLNFGLVFFCYQAPKILLSTLRIKGIGTSTLPLKTLSFILWPLGFCAACYLFALKTDKGGSSYLLTPQFYSYSIVCCISCISGLIDGFSKDKKMTFSEREIERIDYEQSKSDPEI